MFGEFKKLETLGLWPICRKDDDVEDRAMAIGRSLL